MSDTHPTVPTPPRERPLLLYDGECAFCLWWLTRWRQRLGTRVDAEPFQRAGARFPTLPRQQFQRAVHLIETDGRVYQGAEAVLRVLSKGPGRGRLYRRIYERVPGARPLLEGSYRFIAGHRPAFHELTLAIWGKTPRRGLPPGRRTALQIAAGGVVLAVVALAVARARKRAG